MESFIKKYVKIVVVLAVIAGASSGIFGKLISAPSMAIGFWRLTFGLPFFAIPVLLRQRDELRQIDGKSLGITFLSGAFLFGHFFCWFNAVKMTNISSAVTLAALHPLVVLFITVFVLRKKVGIRAIIGIGIALIGGAMIAGFDFTTLQEGKFQGDLLAFLTGLFMGVYFVLGGLARRKISGNVYVFVVFLSCWLCFLAGMMITKTAFFGYDLMDYVYLVAMALVCQIGAHAVFNLCLGHIDSLYVSTWESGESVFAIILGVIFLGQIPSLFNLICCIAVVAGLLYYNRAVSLAERNIEE